MRTTGLPACVRRVVPGRFLTGLTPHQTLLEERQMAYDAEKHDQRRQYSAPATISQQAAAATVRLVADGSADGGTGSSAFRGY